MKHARRKTLAGSLFFASIALGSASACGNSSSGGSAAALDATTSLGLDVATASSAATDASDASAMLTPREKFDAGPPYMKLSDSEKESIGKYDAAMKKGRDATKAKKWKDALSAFQEAQSARPGDPRALAELAYAELLGGTDPHTVILHLTDAREASHDDDLTAQIWFNLGLANEKAGDADSAAIAFFRSNALKPSDAAQKKLGTKSFACGVRLTRTALDGHPYDTWLDAYKGLAAIDGANPPPDVELGDATKNVPADEAKARATMCMEKSGCTDEGPWRIRIGEGVSAIHVMMRVDGNKLLAFDAIGAEQSTTRCGWWDQVTIRSGKYLLARSLHMPSQLVPVALDTKGCEPTTSVCTVAGIKECTAADTCHTGCFAEAWTATVHVYDPEQRREITTLEQTGNITGYKSDPIVPEIEARLDGDNVRLLGCTESFAIGGAPVPDGGARDAGAPRDAGAKQARDGGKAR